MPKKRKRDPVVIGIATIKERFESLIDTLASLRAQADEIHVYMNYVDDENKLEIKHRFGSLVTVRDVPLGDIGDAGMMYPFVIEKRDMYCFTAGDDIIYPPDYVQNLIDAIEARQRASVVGYHGRRQFSPVESYYRSLKSHEAFNCLRAVSQDERVTILGTAACAWHSSVIDMTIEDFPEPNMADIWFSKLLNEAGVPRVVLAHKAGYLKHSTKVDLDTTLARTLRDKDKLQTRVFNSVEWKI